MLSSDEAAFGGFENLSKKNDAEFISEAGDYDGRPHSIQVTILLPSQLLLAWCFSFFKVSTVMVSHGAMHNWSAVPCESITRTTLCVVPARW